MDSGSHYTIISQKMVASLGLSRRVTPSSKRYSAINGETQGFTRQLEQVPIELGEASLKVTVQVTPANSYPLLIGQDILRLLRMDILTSQIGRAHV